VVSSFFSILIGTFGAISLLKNNYKFEKLSLAFYSIPLINADIITGVSLMIMFTVLGMTFGLTTLILAHISFSVPCVVFIIYNRLRKIDYRQIEAALDLGASFFFTIKEIIFPFIRASILTAFGIVFSMSFDDFIISYFVAGDESNISTYFYTLKRIKPTVNAFSSFLVVVIVFLFLVLNFVKKLFFSQQKNNKQNHLLRKKNKFYVHLGSKIKQSVFLKKTKVFFSKTKEILCLSLVVFGSVGFYLTYQGIYSSDIAMAT
jgi:spermidine/putrescine transport system permease protein